MSWGLLLLINDKTFLEDVLQKAPHEPHEGWKPPKSSQVPITSPQIPEKVGGLLEKELVHSVVLAQFSKLPFIGTILRSQSN